MPKEFSTWVSEMAGTVEDKSVIVHNNQTIDVLTNLQKRVLIADMLVPNPIDEDGVSDWVAAFCIKLDSALSGRKSVTEAYLSDIISYEETKKYTNTEGDCESLNWFRDFKRRINSGELL